MAYSLGDPYRPLRVVMRINGMALGGFCGLGLLLGREATLLRLGILTTEVGWPLRLAGAALLSLGIYLFLNASEPTIELPALTTCVVMHVLFAAILITSYLQGDLRALVLGGRILLVVIFLLCLIGALAPFRYFQAEYRG